MGQILISAAHKSSGKTIVSTGICAALRARNKTIQPFKKGPDYIDPMWLGTAAGRNCYNLDFWTQSHEEIGQLFTSHTQDADLALIEANKGLYDGLDLDGSNSNAALAKLLGASVVLVLDCRGTIRGIAPLLQGYQSFDEEVDIKGVILNFVGGARHEQKLRQVVERYTDLDVIGAIHRDESLSLEERYLGLIPSNEAEEAHQVVDELGQSIGKQVDLDKLLRVANPLPKISVPSSIGENTYSLKVAYARDEAFGFYYADDLETFRQLGATLIPFDALKDSSLPQADALFIGGGFPEKRMQELQANQTMRSQIFNALDNGMPAYAECGGLMYLSRSIRSGEKQANMVGFIDADCVMADKPQGRGYIRFEENKQSFWPQPVTECINGHEFHYSYLENLSADQCFTFNVLRGQGINKQQDGIRVKNTLACYAHQRHTSQNPWISRFLAFAQSCRDNPAA